MLESSVDDPALDACMRSAMRAARWTSTTGDDVVAAVERLSVGDLTAAPGDE